MANPTPAQERPLVENYVFERESKVSPPSMKLSTYAMEHLTDDERSAKDIKSQYVMPELQMVVPGNNPNYHYVSSEELKPQPILANKSEVISKEKLQKWVNSLNADFVQLSVSDTGKLLFHVSGEQDTRTALRSMKSFTDVGSDCRTAREINDLDTGVAPNSSEDCKTAALLQSVLELKTCEDEGDDADCTTAKETEEALHGLSNAELQLMLKKLGSDSARLMEARNSDQPLDPELSALLTKTPIFDTKAALAGSMESAQAAEDLQTGRLLSEGVKTGRLLSEDVRTGRQLSEGLKTGRLNSEPLKTGRLNSEKELRTGRLLTESGLPADVLTARLLSEKLQTGLLNSSSELRTALLNSASQRSTKTALLSSQIPEGDVATAVSPSSFEQMTNFLVGALYGNDSDLHTAAESPLNTARDQFDDADLVTSIDGDLASSTT